MAVSHAGEACWHSTPARCALGALAQGTPTTHTRGVHARELVQWWWWFAGCPTEAGACTVGCSTGATAAHVYTTGPRGRARACGECSVVGREHTTAPIVQDTPPKTAHNAYPPLPSTKCTVCFIVSAAHIFFPSARPSLWCLWPLSRHKQSRARWHQGRPWHAVAVERRRVVPGRAPQQRSVAHTHCCTPHHTGCRCSATHTPHAPTHVQPHGAGQQAPTLLQSTSI